MSEKRIELPKEVYIQIQDMGALRSHWQAMDTIAMRYAVLIKRSKTNKSIEDLLQAKERLMHAYLDIENIIEIHELYTEDSE